jgi:isoquinoline 1-oxidoreductase
MHELNPLAPELFPSQPEEAIETVGYDFGISRRDFVQGLGAGLVITVLASPAAAQQRRGRRGGGPRPVAARVHVGQDGTLTVMTGKVEAGQGARAELSQAAAEELRVGVERIRLIMADTQQVPDDGITAGSRTTPSTVPAVRQGCAAARDVLTSMAAQRWGVDRAMLEVRDGRIAHIATQRSLTYAELSEADELIKAFREAAAADVELTRVEKWKVLGTSVARPNQRDLVTGAHQFPSDIQRPDMLYGKVLRPPAYGAKLTAIDLAPTEGLPGTIVVRDGDFVGVAAPTSLRAAQAITKLEKHASWQESPHPSSSEVYEHLRRHTRGEPRNPFAEELAKATRTLKQTYHVAYVQHAPLEPRAAVAEWRDGHLTVWTGTQNPFGVRSELMRAFHLPEERVRVVVPDFGAGFGGKHSGETAVEAARLAKAAGKPVSLRWTRQEEFTWAYFRPAAVINVEAGLDEDASMTSWYFVNINSGGAAIETPYRIQRAKSEYVPSAAPLRHGSYRALAATANNFARECFMDELATAADRDPLDFRLAHLENPRLRAVLEEAARRFDWPTRFAKREPGTGVGLACGTEKGSYVAACAEVTVGRASGEITVRRVCQVFECGAILNPDNLLAQVQGCILMGLGPALSEEVQFENGRISNASFRRYRLPRFKDVPELDIHLLNRPDLDSVGGGETPIIAVAPAVANAVFHATGTRVRQMPIRLPAGAGA